MHSIDGAPEGQGEGMLRESVDITEKKRAVEEREWLAQAVEQSPSTVVITDVRGAIEYVNPKFTELTGYRSEEVLGRNPRLLKSGEQPPSFYVELWNRLGQGEEWRGEFSNRRKDGTLYWESASISPVRDAEGKVTHYLKVAEDITAQKQAEEALRQRTIELQKRNEELDAFAHTVAHDLKSPLNLVIGYAEILMQARTSVPAEELEKYSKVIFRYARKMNNIIDELLLLAGLHKVEAVTEPVHMESVVSEAQNRLIEMIQEREAEIALPKSWPQALGYAPWVEEVWVNYLSNAIKYGGTPPHVQLGATVENDGMVRFWIQDNGPGLSTEELARMFVPFTQLAQVRAEGHGLGLSIVRRIVEKLGGEVVVQSAGVPGQGCRFSFTLPGVEVTSV